MVVVCVGHEEVERRHEPGPTGRMTSTGSVCTQLWKSGPTNELEVFLTLDVVVYKETKFCMVTRPLGVSTCIKDGISHLILCPPFR